MRDTGIEPVAYGELDAARSAGVDRIWTDVGSGVRTHRPALAELVAAASAGDTVVVCRLDRLGRSLPELLALVENLTSRGVGLRSLAEQIDTTSAAGRLVLHVFGALAEFEHALMHERTMAGLAAARARGRSGGRPRALSAAQRAHAAKLAGAGKPIREIAEILGAGRSTVYRALKEASETCARPPRVEPSPEPSSGEGSSLRIHYGMTGATGEHTEGRLSWFAAL